MGSHFWVPTAHPESRRGTAEEIIAEITLPSGYAGHHFCHNCPAIPINSSCWCQPTAIEGSTMLKFIRHLAAVLILFIPCVTRLGAATQPAVPYITPRMMELIHEHQSVLADMNAHSNNGKLSQVSDPRMKPLLTEGWRLVSCLVRPASRPVGQRSRQALR
jgi:hypothetical protein